MAAEETPIGDLVRDVEACLDVGTVAAIQGPAGVGKCLAKGTPVLMFDGTVKAVEDVEVGDQLIGPDSRPRNVLSLARGREMMYRVTPTKGDPYVVNESHILSLKLSPGDGRAEHQVVNVSVRDYLGRSDNFRRQAKGWRAGVDWAAGDVAIDPYVLGTWLGDGHGTGPTITTPDAEVVAAWEAAAAAEGAALTVFAQAGKATTYHLSTGRGPGLPRTRGRMRAALRDYGLLDGEKFVPWPYLVNDRPTRLAILAGIVDADGHLEHGCYDLVFKSDRLAAGVCHLARSLGLAAYRRPCEKTCCNTGVTGTYTRITISGDLDSVPCRVPRRIAGPRQQNKDVLVHGITVTPVGVDDYYGFEIDGDRLFLLGDFTVTHNTKLVEAIARRRGGRFVTIIGSLADPTDINGFPVVQKGETVKDGAGRGHPVLRFAPREAFVDLDREGGLLFFDELTSSPATVQAAMLRGIQDRVFGDFPLDPFRVGIVVAYNPPDIAVNGTELGMPMLNRLTHFDFPVGDSARYEWCENFPGYWGNPPTVGFGKKTLPAAAMLRARSYVAGYVRAHPDEWLPRRAETTETGDRSPGSPSPRSWERVSRHVGWAIANNVHHAECHRRVAGEIGASAAASFLVYMRETSLPDPEALLADPDSYAPTGRPDLDFTTTVGVAAAVEANPTAPRFLAGWKVLSAAVADRAGHGPAYEAGMAAAVRLAKFFSGDNYKQIKGKLSGADFAKVVHQTHKLAGPFLDMLNQVKTLTGGGN